MLRKKRVIEAVPLTEILGTGPDEPISVGKFYNPKSTEVSNLCGVLLEIDYGKTKQNFVTKKIFDKTIYKVMITDVSPCIDDTKKSKNPKIVSHVYTEKDENGKDVEVGVVMPRMTTIQKVVEGSNPQKTVNEKILISIEENLGAKTSDEKSEDKEGIEKASEIPPTILRNGFIFSSTTMSSYANLIPGSPVILSGLCIDGIFKNVGAIQGMTPPKTKSALPYQVDKCVHPLFDMFCNLASAAYEKFEYYPLYEIMEDKSKEVICYVPSINSRYFPDNFKVGAPNIPTMVKCNGVRTPDTRFPVFELKAFVFEKDEETNLNGESKKVKVKYNAVDGVMESTEYGAKSESGIAIKREEIIKILARDDKPKTLDSFKARGAKYVLGITKEEDHEAIFALNQPDMIFFGSFISKPPSISDEKIRHESSIQYGGVIGNIVGYVSVYGLAVSDAFARHDMLHILNDIDILERKTESSREESMWIHDLDGTPSDSIRKEFNGKAHADNPFNMVDGLDMMNLNETSKSPLEFMSKKGSKCRILIGKKKFTAEKIMAAFEAKVFGDYSVMDVLKLNVFKTAPEKQIHFISECLIYCIFLARVQSLVGVEDETLIGSYTDMIDDKIKNGYKEAFNVECPFKMSSFKWEFFKDMVFVAYGIRTVSIENSKSEEKKEAKKEVKEEKKEAQKSTSKSLPQKRNLTEAPEKPKKKEPK